MGCFLVSEFRDSIPTSLYFTEGLQISFHLGPIFFHLGNNWKPFLLLGKYAKSYVLHAISHLCLLNYLSLLLWVADCELSVELLFRCLMNCQTISKLWLDFKTRILRFCHHLEVLYLRPSFQWWKISLIIFLCINHYGVLGSIGILIETNVGISLW